MGLNQENRNVLRIFKNPAIDLVQFLESLFTRSKNIEEVEHQQDAVQGSGYVNHSSEKSIS
jgi:hypothetical protein